MRVKVVDRKGNNFRTQQISARTKGLNTCSGQLIYSLETIYYQKYLLENCGRNDKENRRRLDDTSF
jgi:hypothetical protein